MCVHPNDCGHEAHEFYDTVEVAGYGTCDLYFFFDNSRGWEYCLRYGELGDYSSFDLATLMKFVFAGNKREKDVVILNCFIDYMNRKERNNETD